MPRSSRSPYARAAHHVTLLRREPAIHREAATALRPEAPRSPAEGEPVGTVVVFVGPRLRMCARRPKRHSARDVLMQSRLVLAVPGTACSLL